jgi:hypothetical protein
MAHDVKQPHARQARMDEPDGMNSAPACGGQCSHPRSRFLESADLLVRARRPDLQSAGFAHKRAAPLLTKKEHLYTGLSQGDQQARYKYK